MANLKQQDALHVYREKKGNYRIPKTSPVPINDTGSQGHLFHDKTAGRYHPHGVRKRFLRSIGLADVPVSASGFCLSLAHIRACDPCGARTRDPDIKSVELYQLS